MQGAIRDNNIFIESIFNVGVALVLVQKSSHQLSQLPFAFIFDLLLNIILILFINSLFIVNAYLEEWTTEVGYWLSTSKLGPIIISKGVID